MQTEFIMPRVVDGKAAGSVPARNGELADFSTDRRVLLLFFFFFFFFFFL